MEEFEAPGEYEQEGILSRAEIAERLHRLADQIALGTLSLGKAQVPLPERADYEVDCDVDGGKGELSIEIEWH